MFSAGMVGSYEGPAGLPGTEKILGFRPSRTKSGGTFGVFFPIGRVEASVFVRGDCPEPRIFGPLCQGVWGFTRVPRVRVLAGALLPSAAMKGPSGRGGAQARGAVVSSSRSPRGRRIKCRFCGALLARITTPSQFSVRDKNVLEVLARNRCNARVKS